MNKFVYLCILVAIEHLMNFSDAQTFKQFGFNEYYVEKNEMVRTYLQAEEKCNAMKQAALAVVKSEEIQSFLIKNIGALTKTPYSFYIGLKRKNLSRLGFEWIDGTPLSSSYSDWYEGEPNNFQGNKEDCVIMGWKYEIDERFQWRDVKCNYGSLFICQRSINKGNNVDEFKPSATSFSTTYLTRGSNSSSSSTAVIVVIIVLIILLLIAVGIAVMIKKKKRKSEQGYEAPIVEYAEINYLPKTQSNYFQENPESNTYAEITNQNIEGRKIKPTNPQSTIAISSGIYSEVPQDDNKVNTKVEVLTNLSSTCTYSVVQKKKNTPQPTSSSIYSEVPAERNDKDST